MAVSLGFKSGLPSSMVVLFINFDISQVIMYFINFLLPKPLPIKHDIDSLPCMRRLLLG